MAMRGADGAGATDGAGGVPKGRKRRGRDPVRPGWSDVQIEELVRLAQLGQSSKEIAKALHISHRTVELHRSHLFEKLGVRSAVDLVRFAVDAGVR